MYRLLVLLTFLPVLAFAQIATDQKDSAREQEVSAIKGKSNRLPAAVEQNAADIQVSSTEVGGLADQVNRNTADIAALVAGTRQTMVWLVGLRYYDSDFEMSPAPVADEKDWGDSVVGARWGWSISERWSLSARGDIGGFGPPWQVVAIADWQPWKHVSFTGSLRAVGIDVRDGDWSKLFAYDITPVLGVNIQW